MIYAHWSIVASPAPFWDRFFFLGRSTHAPSHRSSATDLELIDQRVGKEIRFPQVDEPEIVHVLPRHTADVLWVNTPEVIDKTSRRSIVALVNLRAREESRLVAIRLVLEEVIGDELLNESLQTMRINQLALQPIDLSAHEL